MQEEGAQHRVEFTNGKDVARSAGLGEGEAGRGSRPRAPDTVRPVVAMATPQPNSPGLAYFV